MRKEVEEYLAKAARKRALEEAASKIEEAEEAARERENTLIACGLYTKGYAPNRHHAGYPEKEGRRRYRKVPLEVSDEEYAAILETQPETYTKGSHGKNYFWLRLGLNAMAMLGYVVGIISVIRGFGILGLGFYFSLSTLMLGVSALLWDSWEHARE